MKKQMHSEASDWPDSLCISRKSTVLGWLCYWWQNKFTFYHWHLPSWMQQVMSPVHKRNTKKVYKGNGGKAPHILNPSTKWSWLVSFMHRLSYPRTSGTRTGGRAGPRTGLEVVKNREILIAACIWSQQPSLWGSVTS